MKIGLYNLSKEEVLLFLPYSYELREVITHSNYREKQKYVFQFKCLTVVHQSNQIIVKGIVLDKVLTVVHSKKFARMFYSNKVISLCGEISSNYYSFFPDLFDLRVGIVAKYKRLGVLSTMKLHKFIEEEWKELWPFLKKIHQPKSYEDINSGFNTMLTIELGCFLQKIKSEKFSKVPMVNKSQINLPFNLSPSQKIAIDDIYKDLESTETVTRLLYGDVGSGKTIVALLASLKVADNGKNTLFLVPTVLLAQQVFEYYKKNIS